MNNETLACVVWQCKWEILEIYGRLYFTPFVKSYPVGSSCVASNKTGLLSRLGIMLLFTCTLICTLWCAGATSCRPPPRRFMCCWRTWVGGWTACALSRSATQMPCNAICEINATRYQFTSPYWRNFHSQGVFHFPANNTTESVQWKRYLCHTAVSSATNLCSHL